MESSSVVAIVIGLVGSLGNFLRILRDFVSRYVWNKFSHDFERAEVMLALSSRNLLEVQSKLRAEWMHSHLNKLVDVLDPIEQFLRDLHDSVDRAQSLRTKLLSRRHNAIDIILLRHEMEVAKSNIIFALHSAKMIRSLQSQISGKNIVKLAVQDFAGTEEEWKKGASTDQLIKPRRRDSILTNDICIALWQRNSYRLLPGLGTKNQQVITWISGPELQTQFHHQCRAERLTGTGNWLSDTNEFKTWLNYPITTGDKGLLWLQGKPGIGKTMLMSKIIDELSMTQFVAYFYMSSGRPHSAFDFTASLLKQLLLYFHILPRPLEEAYEKTNGNSEQELELTDMLDYLRETSRDIQRPTTIVLDGLDEMNMREHKDFIKVFSSLKETSWKFLITSRTDQDDFTGASGSCHRFLIQDENIAKDIENFVEFALSGNKAIDDMLSDHHDLREEIVHTLASRSNGMFYWVSLQLQTILNQTHLSDIRSALQKAPIDLAGIVESAFKMIRSQDESRAQLAIRTLALLTSSVAPLTDGALCHAMALAHVLDFDKYPKILSGDDIPNRATIIECCGALITIDPIANIVTLKDYDISQYMRQHWTDLFPREEMSIKVKIARICMAYLSLEAFSNGPCHQIDAFRERLERYPFLDYASRYWGHHVQEALLLPDIDEDVSTEAKELLENRMNLESCLQVSEMKPEVQEAILQGKGHALTLDIEKLKVISFLQVATRHGLTKIVQNVLDIEPRSVLDQDSCGTSPLHEAARAGQTELVNILLNAGAQLSVMDKEGKTPLYYAAEGGHEKIMSALNNREDDYPLKKSRTSIPQVGINQESMTSMQMTPGNLVQLEKAFGDAVKAGKTDIVKSLIKNEFSSDLVLQSALVIAVCGENKAVVQLLLEHGANPNPQPSLGRNIPLHQAIRFGYVKIAKTLLDFGANLNACDEFGQTALFETLNIPDLEGAGLLLQHGISLSFKDGEGNTVLHKAATRGAFKHAMLFLNQGIEVDLRNSRMLTPLILATQAQHYEVVDILLEKGARIDACDSEGQTSLMHATWVSDMQICQRLLAGGASLKRGDGRKTTPLGVAITAGNLEILRLLLEWGATIEERDQNSQTPIMLAAKIGRFEIVDLLLKWGADVRQRDQDLQTPIMLAEAGGHVQIVQLLNSFKK